MGWPWPAFGVTLIELLVVIAIIAVLIAAAARGQAARAARRACINNLKQIGQLIATRADQQPATPSARITSSPGPCHRHGPQRLSWMVGILPYVEQTNLMNAMNYNGNADPGLG